MIVITQVVTFGSVPIRLAARLEIKGASKHIGKLEVWLQAFIQSAIIAPIGA
jgi:hypothetical protein